MIDSRSKQGFRSARRRQRGVSLIEILIVLVILVVGILTIIRLYPSGFFSLESTGNSALADGLGAEALQAQAQNSFGLPEGIFPGPLDLSDRAKYSALIASQYGDYDPDDPNTLDNARAVSSETITVPSPRAVTGGGAQSLYVVSYGPIALPSTVSPGSAQLPSYLSIFGLPWQAQAGDNAGADRPQDDLHDDTKPYQTNFLLDLAHKQIAVPYAPYTETSSTTAQSFDQRMILMITGSDGMVYTEYLNVPAATPRDSASAADANAPYDTNNRDYLPDSATNYQGGWFDPTMTYPDTTPNAPATPQVPVPNTVSWTKVVLLRAFQGVAAPTAFTADPYEFTLASPNFGGAGANPGAIAFNTLAAGGNGVLPLKARISYQTFSWNILHEDRDIPALAGSSDTSAVRLTLKNLLYAGAAQPDNTIFTGLAGGNLDMIILNLDTGDWQTVTPKLFNEDTNGPDTTGTKVNVSYATGRLTFPGGIFGDNAAHRIRVFYAGDAGWTVAVQKAASLYSRKADIAGTTDPQLAPGEFALDPMTQVAYFPRCDAGKTVELDGTYVSGGATQGFTDTVAIDPAAYPLGATNYVRVDLTDVTRVATPIPTTATSVTFTAVRGLSARAVVAWKERDHWKVHSVDTVLTRPQ